MAESLSNGTVTLTVSFLFVLVFKSDAGREQQESEHCCHS